MKNMKKFAALFMAGALAFAMPVPTFADANAYKIVLDTSANKAAHTYEVYQIFTGDLSTGEVLSNLKWGSSVSGKTAGDEVASTDIPTTDTIETFINGLTLGTAVATVNSTAGDATTSLGTNFPAGYYLIKDKDNTLANSQDAYTKYILQVVSDVDGIAPKAAVPTLEKKVKENVKYTSDAGYGTGYNDVADWCIGDDVPFELIGTLPSLYTDYKTYKYVFTDTLAAGLTLNDDVKVFLSADKKYDAASDTEITSMFTKAVNGQTFTLTCNDLKANTNITATSNIIVTYTAELNANAVIGLDGNVNTAKLSFSNNPNYTGAGAGAPTGDTPNDDVIVFTYLIDVTKKDGSVDPMVGLANAGFKLTNAAGKYAVVEKGKLTGWADAEADGTELVSGTDGKFGVAGLDDGEYTLTETTVPTGYNKAKDITVTITGTTTNGQNWTSGKPSDALTITGSAKNSANETITVTIAKNAENKDAGIAFDIANYKGATLPETGGMGTTVIYLAGAICVIGAGVLLFTKKRMAAK